MPDLVGSRSRRTQRLAGALTRIGLSLGGEAARLARHLGMGASGDTILRLIHDLPLPRRNAAPSRAGIDGRAIRKGRTCGTIVVDLERRQPADLLPDRSAATVAAWLRDRPDVELVARDRSTQYARAVSDGAPRAMQVAGRWHLLLDMGQAVERWASRARGRLRRLPRVDAERTDAGGSDRTIVDGSRDQRAQAFRRGRADMDAGDAHRARRREVHAETRRRFLAGESLAATSRATGLSRGTVRKCAHGDEAPERRACGPGAGRLDPCTSHLDARLRAGCENASALRREIVALGYTGTPEQVLRYMTVERQLT